MNLAGLYSWFSQLCVRQWLGDGTKPLPQPIILSSTHQTEPLNFSLTAPTHYLNQCWPSVTFWLTLEQFQNIAQGYIQISSKPSRCQRIDLFMPNGTRDLDKIGSGTVFLLSVPDPMLTYHTIKHNSIFQSYLKEKICNFDKVTRPQLECMCSENPHCLLIIHGYNYKSMNLSKSWISNI